MLVFVLLLSIFSLAAADENYLDCKTLCAILELSNRTGKKPDALTDMPLHPVSKRACYITDALATKFVIGTQPRLFIIELLTQLNICCKKDLEEKNNTERMEQAFCKVRLDPVSGYPTLDAVPDNKIINELSISLSRSIFVTNYNLDISSFEIGSDPAAYVDKMLE